MGRVTYLEFDGTAHAVELENGISVMEGAVRNGIPGIDGDCGGMRACATCHVHVVPDWEKIVGGPGDEENELLDLAPERDSASRLSCQIIMSAELDGVVVQMPEGQH
jgi:2Fe-2S ferredoxin